jgi:glycosyltransferase involved in cell wall biosynthesis
VTQAPLIVADGDIATTRLVARELGAVYPEVEVRTADTLFGTRFAGRPVVISRLCHPCYAWLPDYLAERGIPYVYFLDDNFWELTPDVDRHVASFFNHPAVLATLDRFVRGATRTIVWSRLLREYLVTRFPETDIVFAAPGVDAGAIDRLLARRAAEAKPRAAEVRIGYPTTRRPGVASLLTAIVAHFAATRGGAVRFEFVGWMPDELMGAPYVTLYPHVADYAAYLELVVARRWDIGIAPLAGGRFESFKTDIKYREYGACRIPSVYSRVPPYSDVVVDGTTGLLAGNDAGAWIAALEALVDSARTREAIAAAAHDDVVRHRDLRVTGRRFAELVAG